MGLCSVKVEFVSLWQIGNKLFGRVKKNSKLFYKNILRRDEFFSSQSPIFHVQISELPRS